jgi:hypothetical protein
MSQLAARLIHLESSATREPNCRNASVIQCGGKFVESGDAFSAWRNQVVDRDVQNEGSLVQTALRFAR